VPAGTSIALPLIVSLGIAYSAARARLAR